MTISSTRAPDRMLAVYQDTAGPPDVLKLVEIDRPTPTLVATSEYRPCKKSRTVKLFSLACCLGVLKAVWYLSTLSRKGGSGASRSSSGVADCSGMKKVVA